MPSCVHWDTGEPTVPGAQAAVQFSPTIVLSPQLNLAFVNLVFGLPLQTATRAGRRHARAHPYMGSLAQFGRVAPGVHTFGCVHVARGCICGC